MRLSIASTVTTVSVSLSLVAFIGTVLAHIYIIISKKYGPSVCVYTKRSTEEEELLLQEDTSNDQGMYSPSSCCYEKRVSDI